MVVVLEPGTGDSLGIRRGERLYKNFKRARFLAEAHGLTAFAFALWDWKSAAQSSAGFAASNSSLP